MACNEFSFGNEIYATNTFEKCHKTFKDDYLSK